MIELSINTNYLNASLQVGDLVYARSIDIKTGAEDAQQDTNGIYKPTNGVNIVGVLKKIKNPTPGSFLLEIDEDEFNSTYVAKDGDFIMFSKYDQSMGDLIGYYAQAKFTNNSREKAEIFSVGSEVIINSK